MTWFKTHLFDFIPERYCILVGVLFSSFQAMFMSFVFFSFGNIFKSCLLGIFSGSLVSMPNIHVLFIDRFQVSKSVRFRNIHIQYRTHLVTVKKFAELLWRVLKTRLQNANSAVRFCDLGMWLQQIPYLRKIMLLKSDTIRKPHNGYTHRFSLIQYIWFYLWFELHTCGSFIGFLVISISFGFDKKFSIRVCLEYFYDLLHIRQVFNVLFLDGINNSENIHS